MDDPMEPRFYCSYCDGSSASNPCVVCGHTTYPYNRSAKDTLNWVRAQRDTAEAKLKDAITRAESAEARTQALEGERDGLAEKVRLHEERDAPTDEEASPDPTRPGG